MHRTSIIILFVLLSSFTCVSQSSYKGLTPGKSTRLDLEQVLGRPLRELSETLVEYKSDRPTQQVFVQYGRDTGVVVRIEVAHSDALERSVVLRSVDLPELSTAWQTNAKQKLEEYFSSKNMVLTYAGEDASTGVSRIGYYSSELFQNASAKLPSSAFGKGAPPIAGNNGEGAQSSNSSSAPVTSGNGGSQQPAQPPPPKYEDIVARANGALQAQDYQNAIRLSQQAVDMDPNRPQAYETVGIAQLYGLKDFGAGATAMRAAVQRGGSASFAVTHDHDGFFQSYCQGSLYISKQGVTYRSNDGSHTFAVNYANVKGTGLNNFVGSNLHSFHIKVVENNKTRNYNFAPGTFSAAEANMILALLKSP
jgi:hypothetical protein